MPAELTFMAAMAVGLLGSPHCIGMCGGIVGALGVGLNPDLSRESRPAPVLVMHLAYNFGRISSYVAIGFVAGWLGEGISAMTPATRIPIAPLITSLFMIALGLYIANWWHALVILEKLGYHAWRRIQPLAQRLLPARRIHHAYLLGIAWGWLPCGLVYTAVAWALTTADPMKAAALLLGFGLGTMPAMLLVGNAFTRFKQWINSPVARKVAAVAIIAFGMYNGYSAIESTHLHEDPGPIQYHAH